jgi:hypothetical protein
MKKIIPFVGLLWHEIMARPVRTCVWKRIVRDKSSHNFLLLSSLSLLQMIRLFKPLCYAILSLSLAELRAFLPFYTILARR